MSEDSATHALRHMVCSWGRSAAFMGPLRPAWSAHPATALLHCEGIYREVYLDLSNRAASVAGQLLAASQQAGGHELPYCDNGT